MNKRLSRVLLSLVLISGVALAIYHRDSFNVDVITTLVDESGFWGPVLFILIYACATVFFLPGSVITLVGGVLFGPIWGTLYNLTGATLGAAICFLVARFIASDWVSEKVGGKVKQLIEGVEREGWRFVAFVRLVPLFPFNLLNYALGLTKIKFSHYVIASFIFMFPGGLAYTYIGYVGREALSGEEGVIYKILIAIALLAVVSFLPRLVKIVRGDIPKVEG